MISLFDNLWYNLVNDCCIAGIVPLFGSWLIVIHYENEFADNFYICVGIHIN